MQGISTVMQTISYRFNGLSTFMAPLSAFLPLLNLKVLPYS
jgi:hypothetical protein